MPYTVTANLNANALNNTATVPISVQADNAKGFSPQVSAAKTGTLTTRTDDDTGTLTMEASHGITTGAIIDIYWDGGALHGVTVGTVSGNSVPFDIGDGSGDALPVATTAITAAVPHEESHVVAGDDVVAIIIDSPAYRTTVSFVNSSHAELWAVVLEANGGGFVWTSEIGVDNPLDSAAVAYVRISIDTAAIDPVTVNGSTFSN